MKKKKKAGPALGLKAGLGVKPACTILREKHRFKDYFGLSKMSGRKEGATEHEMDLHHIRFGERKDHCKSSPRKGMLC